MPELPEVETIANDLHAQLVGKQIIDIQVRQPKMIKGSVQQFISTLKNNNFINVSRRAKFLIFTLASKELMLGHLRMTGQLIYQDKNKLVAGGHGVRQDLVDLPGKHTHIIITFANGGRLFFNDLRRFGFLQLIKLDQLDYELRNFGQEPLATEFTWLALQQMLMGRKTGIKAFLLNQKHIAGLGNIYVDEVLFAAKVRPDRLVTSLSVQEIKRIHLAIKRILAKAIAYRGTTFNDYRDASGRKGNFLAFLKVYSRAGQQCLRCQQGKIVKTKLAGRGSSYCPDCQV
jgi:formamidopyrimidine-DNA glycosylase